MKGFESNMNQLENQGYYNPDLVIDYAEYNVIDAYEINAYMAKVFGWMFYGLLVTVLTTVALVLGINSSPAFAQLIETAFNLMLFIILAQFGLVIALGARVHAMHPTTAKMLFTLYAALNGLTFGLIVYFFGAYVIGMGTVVAAFGITCVSFGAMAIYGMTTKKDLTSWGSLLFVGLIGILLAGFASMFMQSGMLDFIVIVGGLVLFLGIVAHRTNMIKSQYAQVILQGQNEDGTIDQYQYTLAENLAINSALGLYLAFVNIFLRVLMILARAKGGGGGRR